MTDLAIELDDRPGALAEMGKALGPAGVSIADGGGVFVHQLILVVDDIERGRKVSAEWSAGAS